MKGIILAGGSGTRLYPITLPTCKQLLPVYDKPMVYYPLSVLMLADIREVLIIATPKDIGRFEEIFGHGRQLGMKISYAVQDQPRGLADALIIGEEFLSGAVAAMVLGDNIFFGHGLPSILAKARRSVESDGGAHIFGYYVSDPQRFGVVTLDSGGKALSLEEKPRRPKSNYATLGLYFYDNQASKIASAIKPSDRGELEITTVNQEYLKRGKLRVSVLGRGFAWFDAGTADSLLEAGEFVATIEKRTGLKIGCVEEVAHALGFITDAQLAALAKPLSKSNYGQYLLRILKEKPFYSQP